MRRDGDDTYWMSNTNQKDEFIGVKFSAAVDVKMVKLKVSFFSKEIDDHCGRFTNIAVSQHPILR